jgi:ABC-2 type transport system permease protein
MKGNNFTETKKLLKFFIRRDRFILPVWALLPMVLLSGQVSFVDAMENWKEFITELSSSPLTQAYLGPIVPLSKEGAVLWRAMPQGSMAVMLGAALTTIRHTRTEEWLNPPVVNVICKGKRSVQVMLAYGVMWDILPITPWLYDIYYCICSNCCINRLWTLVSMGGTCSGKRHYR